MPFSDHLHVKDWTFSSTSRAAQRRNELALYILVASLGMFFAAALLAYLLIRLRHPDPPPIHLPLILWASTAFAVAGSTLLWQSLRSIRRERQTRFRKQILVAFACGIAFCTTQSIGLTPLLREHLETSRARAAAQAAANEAAREALPPNATGRTSEPATRGPLAEPFPVRNRPAAVASPMNRLEGLVFVLILLHVLHFVAGMIGLSIVTFRGLAGRYDHEYHGGVRQCAVYWRFLDVVWIVLFGAFLFTS